MPVFTPSTIPWATAVEQIADCIGASGDTEMRTRAHRSLRAAFQHFNGRYKWDFLRTEAAPTVLVAPFTVTGVTSSGGAVSAASPAGHGVLVDDLLIGSGFVLGTRVTATAASGFGFNVAVSFTGTAVVTASCQRDLYDLPTDWKQSYSLRLLSGQRVLRYAGRRAYDRTVSDELAAGPVYWYDLFRAGSGGKIRFLEPPSTADVLLHRYFRRMGLASASAVTSNLDIPEDYENYPIAWAKWHFLVDKAEGRSEQATTWLQLANEGLTTMVKEQTALSDADLGFMPGATVTTFPTDRSTWQLDWNS